MVLESTLCSECQIFFLGGFRAFRLARHIAIPGRGRPPLTLQSLLFFGKSKGFSPKKARVFFFAEPLKSLEKRGKTHKKSKEHRKTKKKQGNRKKKKQGLEGQGLGRPSYFWGGLGSFPYPKGPKIEKIQDLEIFKRA